MNYDNYFTRLEANQVHIGIQDPLGYITLVKTRKAYPLLKMVNPDGSMSYRGIIITRKDSGVNQIVDLKGKKVAASSDRAVGGFIAQVVMCMKKGINVETDCRVFLVGTEDNVINAVYSGEADAGFVREDALSVANEKIDLSKLKIIGYTEYFPNWCVSAFKNTDREVANKITTVLLSLDRGKEEDREILDAIDISGFVPASDSDYNIIREKMKALNIPY
jgi:phosphate/phosphite/phosphonate ABC transporter binding protein